MRIHAPRPLTLIATGLLLFLYVPIAVVFLYAFNSGANLSWPPQGLSLRWFEQIFNDPSFRSAMFQSLKVALISTSISTLVAAPAALIIARQQWFLPTIIDSVSRLPIMIPPLMIGLALLTTIGMLDLQLSTATIVAGHMIYVIPYVLVVVVTRLQSFDGQLEEAARDLGAGPMAAFRLVTLPIIMPAILGAGLLAIGLSFDETFITNFTAGNHPTLPLYVLSKLRRTVDPSINAVATILIVIPWIALGLSAAIMGRSLKGRQTIRMDGEE